MNTLQEKTPLEIITESREAGFSFFHGNKLWVAYAAYVSDEVGNLYFPADEKTNLHKGIKKEGFVSATVELLNQETGDAEYEAELKGKISPFNEDIQSWNDKFTEKYNMSMTKEIAEMMLHKKWYTLQLTASSNNE